MANSDSLSQQTADVVSNYRIGIARGVTLNTVQAGLVTIPILGGGLTNGGAAGNSGGIIVRRITVQNPTGSLASTVITVGTSSGDTSIVSLANGNLSAVTSNATFKDMTTTATYVAGSTTQCIYVNVTTASGNSNTADIVVWGDVVKF